MHIQLLPSVRPPERPFSSGVPRVELVPGQRVMATVLSADLDGRPRLAFAGHEAASRTPLPFAPGTRLLLEVIESFTDEPHLRVIQPGREPLPPVSSASYGYAAAVLAARTATDPSPTIAALLQWLPLLVARGVLTQAQAVAFWRDLAPVGARPQSPDDGGGEDQADGQAEAHALADALATRLAREPALLEARLASVQRQDGDPSALLAGDVRARLARLARALSEPGMDGHAREAGAAVERVQDALLAEQARVAGHLARDGVLDLRLPVMVGARHVDLRLRVGDAPEGDAGSGSRQPNALHVQLDLTLDGLGRVQVRLDTSGPHLRAELVTERASAADAIERGLADLTAALGAAGFSEVFTRVAIDPVRIASGDRPLDLPPDGSIVNVEA